MPNHLFSSLAEAFLCGLCGLSEVLDRQKPLSRRGAEFAEKDMVAFCQPNRREHHSSDISARCAIHLCTAGAEVGLIGGFSLSGQELWGLSSVCSAA